ncbi:MAG: hypothetical protein FJ303_05185 [Planctomycetes bacterium]|nr:hypothetical protein [Planctomycetota bacterium]
MNVWRLFGIGLFLLGLACLIGTTQFNAFANDKKVDPKDDKKVDTKKVDPKDEKKVDPKDVKKVDPKDEKKVDPKDIKKPDPKDEKKVDPPKAGAAAAFSAFDKGNKFIQKQYTRTKQEMKVQNQTVIQTQEQTFLIEWSAQDKDAKGNYVVKQKIIGVKMEINIGGNKIVYDSTSPTKAKNPMTDFFEALTKQELTFTISSDLQKVEGVDGDAAFIKGLSEINPQMQNLLKHILSKKALEKMAEPTWFAFPKDVAELATGKTWNRESDLDLGPIGKYKTKFDFKYVELKDKKDKIGIETKLTYEAPAEKAGLPFVIHEAKLTATDGKGEATFDREKGRFESSKLSMKLNGTLTIEVGGMKTTVVLDQDQDATSNTYDFVKDKKVEEYWK